MSPGMRSALLGGLLLCLPVLAVGLILGHSAGIAMQRTLTLFLVNLIAVVSIIFPSCVQIRLR